MDIPFGISNIFIIGVWLSLVERYVRDVEVAGSNPVTPIFVCLKIRISFDAESGCVRRDFCSFVTLYEKVMESQDEL